MRSSTRLDLDIQAIFNELELTRPSKRLAKLKKLEGPIKAAISTPQKLNTFLSELAKQNLETDYVTENPHIVMHVVDDLEDMHEAIGEDTSKNWIWWTGSIIAHFSYKIKTLDPENTNSPFYAALLQAAYSLTDSRGITDYQTSAFLKHVKGHISDILTELYLNPEYSTESLRNAGYLNHNLLLHYLKYSHPLSGMDSAGFQTFLDRIRLAPRPVLDKIKKQLNEQPPAWTSSLQPESFNVLYTLSPTIALTLITQQNVRALVDLTDLASNQPNLMIHIANKFRDLLMSAIPTAADFRQFYATQKASALVMLKHQEYLDKLLCADLSFDSLVWFAKLWKKEETNLWGMSSLEYYADKNNLSVSAHEMAELCLINPRFVEYIILGQNNKKKYKEKFSNLDDLAALLPATEDYDIRHMARDIACSSLDLFKSVCGNAALFAQCSSGLAYLLLTDSKYEKYIPEILSSSNITLLFPKYFSMLCYTRSVALEDMIDRISSMDDLLAIDSNLRGESHDGSMQENKAEEITLSHFRIYLTKPECSFSKKIPLLFASPDNVSRFLMTSKMLLEPILARYMSEITACFSSLTLTDLMTFYNKIDSRSLPIPFEQNQKLRELTLKAINAAFERADAPERSAFAKDYPDFIMRWIYPHDRPPHFEKSFVGANLKTLADTSPYIAWKVIKANKSDLPSLFQSQAIMHELFQAKPGIQAKVEKKYGEVKFKQ